MRNSPANQWKNAPLGRKGALIVLIPLAAMVVAAGFAVRAFRENSEARELVAHTNDVRNSIFNTRNDLAHAWGDHVEFLVKGPDAARTQDADANEARIHADFGKLASLVADNPDQVQVVHRCREGFATWLKELHAEKAAATRAGRFPTATSPQELLGSMNRWQEVRDDLAAMWDEERRLLDVRWQAQARARERLMVLLALAVLFGVLGTALPAVYFFRSIVARLDALSEYAEKRGKGIPTDIPDDAEDEIGRLAMALRRSADATEERERQLEAAREELESRVADRTAALRESEARARGAFDRSPIGMALVSIDWHWIQVNDALCRIVGYSREELLALKVQDITHPDDRAIGPDFVRRMIADEISGYQVEKRYIHKDGRAVWVLLDVSLVRDHEGEPLYTIGQMQDITERKRAADELRHSLEMLDRTGRISKVGGWEFDAKTLAIRWTDEISRIYELPGPPTLEQAINHYPPEIRPIIGGAIQTCIDVGTPWDMELPFITAKGRHIWVRTIGAAETREDGKVRIYGTFQDVTERKEKDLLLAHATKRSQEQLIRLQLLGEITKAIAGRHDQASLFNTVLGHLRDSFGVDIAVILHFDRDSNLLVVGGRADRLDESGVVPSLEYGAISNLGANGLRDCIGGVTIHVPELSADREGLLKELALAGFRSAAAAPMRSSDTTLGILLVARRTPNAFSSADCEFLTQLGEHAALAIDQLKLLDDLRRTTEDLREAQEQMTQQERLRAMGQMAGGIAHDINNALGPVTLHCELLLENEQLTAQGRKGLQSILDAVDSAAKTIAGLRFFARPSQESPVFTPVQVNSVVDQVVALTKPRWKDIEQQRGREILMELHLSPALPSINGLLDDLRNALTNLIFNAIDAMPYGGTITVRTRPEADRVLLEVSDTGTGMDEMTRRRCLEPFFTTKGERGSGLGLAMVYGVVQRHSGSVEIESSLGVGTTVRLGLPLGDTARQATPLTPRALRPSRQLRILCVDDDIAVRTTLATLLERDGHTVTAAESGFAALDKCVESVPFDVVMTDLGMPGMDGRQFARILLERAPGTPIILLTGWGSHMTEEARSMKEFVAVLSKPPRAHDIREALAKATG